tara:strand:+ start:496 stop:1098 length:603 start_codon:yes stop_codon:yes gene_type:complete
MKNIFSMFRRGRAGVHPYEDRICEAMAHWTTSQLATLEERLSQRIVDLGRRINRQGVTAYEADNGLSKRLTVLEDEIGHAIAIASAHAQDHNARILKLESVPIKITVDPAQITPAFHPLDLVETRRHGVADRRWHNVRGGPSRRKGHGTRRRDYDTGRWLNLPYVEREERRHGEANRRINDTLSFSRRKYGNKGRRSTDG